MLAVYSADNKSLNFYRRTTIPNPGEQFEGRTVTAVYKNIDRSSYGVNINIPCPWD